MPARSPKKAVTHDSDAEDGRDVSLQVMVPARVKREVSLRAAQEATTQRTIILRALKATGIMVKDEELCDRRKVR
jgi:hypothetical protein